MFFNAESVVYPARNTNKMKLDPHKILAIYIKRALYACSRQWQFFSWTKDNIKTICWISETICRLCVLYLTLEISSCSGNNDTESVIKTSSWVQ